MRLSLFARSSEHSSAEIGTIGTDSNKRKRRCPSETLAVIGGPADSLRYLGIRCVKS